MHWCMDETLAVLSMLPFVGMFIRTYKDRVHAWFHRMQGTKPALLKKECPHDHKEEEKITRPTFGRDEPW